MSYTVKLGKNAEVPLPDSICKELGIAVGDILICEKMSDHSSISMVKHSNQALSDDEVAAAGNLTRVFSYDFQEEPTTD